MFCLSSAKWVFSQGHSIVWLEVSLLWMTLVRVCIFLIVNKSHKKSNNYQTFSVGLDISFLPPSFSSVQKFQMLKWKSNQFRIWMQLFFINVQKLLLLLRNIKAIPTNFLLIVQLVCPSLKFSYIWNLRNTVLTQTFVVAFL